MVRSSTATIDSVLYGVTDNPPWYLIVPFAIQQFLTLIGGSIAMPAVVAEAVCMGPDLVGRTELMGTMFVVNGLATLLQTIFGSRLPIIQGPSFGFVATMMALQNVANYQCPAPSDYLTAQSNGSLIPGSPEHQDIWMSRLVQVQGSLMVASVFEVLLGSCGLLGLLLRYIGPLAIAPTTTLIGLTLAKIGANDISSEFGLAFLTIGLIILFSLIINNVSIPFPGFRRETVTTDIEPVQTTTKTKFEWKWYKVFGMLPVLLSMLFAWTFAAILTFSGALPTSPEKYGYKMRVDLGFDALSEAAWFRLPYPGQWGIPKFNVALIAGFLVSLWASIVESIGDYYACARLSRAPPPPPHAINRGIAVEGLGCILAGAFGSGPGVTSYSDNIGAIGITKVASRRVIYFAAMFMILCGLLPKFAAALVGIPEPIIGAVFVVALSMVTAVGVSNLQYVNMNSTRNLMIFGISVFLGLGIPQWMESTGKELVATGVVVIDQVIVVLLSTGMFVGGAIGAVLDNIIPGTPEQRGLQAFMPNTAKLDQDDADELKKCYDLPFVSEWIRTVKWLRFVPTCSSFEGFTCCTGVGPESATSNNFDTVQTTAV